MRTPIVAVIAAGLLVLGACSSDSSTSATTTTATTGPVVPILFSPEGNNLNAFTTNAALHDANA